LPGRHERQQGSFSIHGKDQSIISARCSGGRFGIATCGATNLIIKVNILNKFLVIPAVTLSLPNYLTLVARG
jgi:hypothetical protein